VTTATVQEGESSKGEERKARVWKWVRTKETGQLRASREDEVYQPRQHLRHE
jgi:hypothetical protein